MPRLSRVSDIYKPAGVSGSDVSHLDRRALKSPTINMEPPEYKSVVILYFRPIFIFVSTVAMIMNFRIEGS